MQAFSYNAIFLSPSLTRASQETCFSIIRLHHELLVVVDVVQTHILCFPDTGLRLSRDSSLEVVGAVSTSTTDRGITVDLAVFFRGDDVSVPVNFDSLCRHADLAFSCRAMHDGLSGTLHDLQFPALAANALKAVEVIVVHRSDILATEDTDFELLGCRVAGRERRASSLEVIKGLVDDSIRTDLLGNLRRRTVVGNQL